VKWGIGVIVLAWCNGSPASVPSAAPASSTSTTTSPSTSVPASASTSTSTPTSTGSSAAADSPDSGADAARDPAVRETLAARFTADPEAAKLALDLYDSMGTTCDVLPAQMFDGGYRGKIQLAPALPVASDRKHLTWVSAALHDYDAFFAGLASHAGAPPPYRWHSLSFFFYRSVGNTTPNAFAEDWKISYNVHGSILTSADQTRETLFHEIFHLNDAAHGDWSPKHLTATQDAIERRCGARTACLTPYAPTSTIVRNGTYYAFQPGNDVHEYAAETALRYYREQRAILRGDPAVRPAFKCGPEENRKTWDALVAEFFAGVDLVPACK
jgi:hypothetical protein